MNNSPFFKIYQVVAPLIFFPLAIWLWLSRYDDVTWLSIFGLLLPISFSTIVPFIGIRMYEIWEVKTKLGNKGFRPHHGLFFGTFTSLFALLCLPAVEAPTFVDMVRASFILFMTVGFINWFWDVVAIKSGMLVVYNKHYAEGASAETIAMQYAPVFFGAFGGVYGFCLRWAESIAMSASMTQIVMVFVVSIVAGVVVPIGLSEAYNIMTMGESGFNSYKPSRTQEF